MEKLTHGVAAGWAWEEWSQPGVGTRLGQAAGTWKAWHLLSLMAAKLD